MGTDTNMAVVVKPSKIIIILKIKIKKTGGFAMAIQATCTEPLEMEWIS